MIVGNQELVDGRDSFVVGLMAKNPNCNNWYERSIASRMDDVDSATFRINVSGMPAIARQEVARYTRAAEVLGCEIGVTFPKDVEFRKKHAGEIFVAGERTYVPGDYYDLKVSRKQEGGQANERM